VTIFFQSHCKTSSPEQMISAASSPASVLETIDKADLVCFNK